MARSPLLIQRPQASLITGNQLPKASGDGVPTPDFSALQQLGARISAKGDRNKALAEAQRGEREADPYLFKGSDGKYLPAPNVNPNWTPERNAAHINTAEQNLLAGIERDLNESLNAAMTKAGTPPGQVPALLEAAGQGVLDAVPEGYKVKAQIRINAEVQQRKNLLAAQQIARQREQDIAGIKLRMDEAADMAVSAVQSGVDPVQHKTDFAKAADELVEQEEISEEQAEGLKRKAFDFIEATGTQKAVVDDLWAGTLTPEEAIVFANKLRGGSEDAEMIASTYFGASNFNVEKERAGEYKTRRVYSTTDMRTKFKDPETTKAVAAEIERQATERARMVKDYTNSRMIWDTINTLPPNTPLYPSLRDDMNKMVDLDFIESGGLQKPGGWDIMTGLVRKSLVMPTGLLNVMKASVISGDPAEAMKAIEAWHAMTKSVVGGQNVGQQIRQSISPTDAALMDNFTQAWKQLASSGDDAAASQQRFKEFQNRIADPQNSPERAIALYNEGNGGPALSGKSSKSFYKDVRTRFMSDYGIPSVPLAFEQEMTTAFHISMVMNPMADSAAVFEEAYERVKANYQASPIYENGFSRTTPLTNPDDMIAPPVFGTMDENRWVNDFAKHNVRKMIDAGMVPLDPEQMGQLELILEDDMILGDSMWLRQTGTNNDVPQFNIIVDLGQGKVAIPITQDGKQQDLIIDPHLARNYLNSKARSREDIKALKELVEPDTGGVIDKMIRNLRIGNLQLQPTGLPDEAFEEWFLRKPSEEQFKFLKDGQNKEEYYKLQLKKIIDSEVTIPKGFDIGPTDLLKTNAMGEDVTAAAVAQMETVLPDGTGGQFMMNIASAESLFGKMDGTFRPAGDVGLFQVNDGPDGAYVEIKRRAAIPGNPIQVAAAKIKKQLGVDVLETSKADLRKPLVGAAFARLYLMTWTGKQPVTVAEQAAVWKEHYNTWQGDGTIGGFISKAGEWVIPKAQASAATAMTRSMAGKGPGAIIDPDGNSNPANFLATEPETQANALRLSSMVGRELIVTPHGGKNNRPDRPGSQHPHGTALDFNIAGMSDSEREDLIANAVLLGYKGLGSYGPNSTGYNTVHLDMRHGKGKQEDGLAVWHYGGGAQPGWFKRGLARGRAMRDANGV